MPNVSLIASGGTNPENYRALRKAPSSLSRSYPFNHFRWFTCEMLRTSPQYSNELYTRMYIHTCTQSHMPTPDLSYRYSVILNRVTTGEVKYGNGTGAVLPHRSTVRQPGIRACHGLWVLRMKGMWISLVNGKRDSSSTLSGPRQEFLCESLANDGAYCWQLGAQQCFLNRSNLVKY